MAIAARYHDGQTAEVHAVGLDYERQGAVGAVIIRDAATRAEMARWTSSDIFAVHGRQGELRLGASGHTDGARLVISGDRDIARIRATLPILAEKRRAETGRQLRLAALATAALASVIVAYLYGVPLLASRIVNLVPIAWERSLGDTVARQMEASLAAEAGFEVCDPDPDSAANRAIARFGAAALAGSGSPFDLDITVVRTDVPNAFALPGGKVYFFSALLERAQTPDEFAGVLAHEIGHVAHRHGMEQLISTAGTGALIGFILGDMTGVSVAAGLGATLIDSRFSRDAERQADRFAADVAKRMDFQPAGLADLLDRVGEDDDFTKAFALLNTHPLTDERRAALVDLTRERPGDVEPPFTLAEWVAIRTMCERHPAGKTKTR
ncbi:M48 family metallopeptidase [Devosia limi]|uniref:Peptidase family M48 n=1 Tax=Devosia limi DSM 17137 TaxID=1121477 RepID=A0A1M4TSA3_9HYPH|nr:M48 family metallopeptidase [Devosia limi]SHE47342.1 Peptidase family M48 [Devosia limi DSM 17137]